MKPSDFHLFGPLKQYLADKWFEADTNMKQDVTSSLQTYHSDISVPKNKPWCLNEKGDVASLIV
jgi:uncharacterized protein (DUF924 family)